MENGRRSSRRSSTTLAEGSYSKDSEIKDGYPEFTYGVLKKLGWDKDLTEAEMAIIQQINPTPIRTRCPGRSTSRAASSAWR